MTKLRLNTLDSTIKSSYRTLAIFEFFAEYKRPATVGDICGALSIPQSSTSNILRSLEEISYLSYNLETRKYFPTMLMSFLCSWKMSQNEEATKIPSILKSLSRSLEENVVLALRTGIYSQYLCIEYFDTTLDRHVETGSVRPLATSATGWSLLKDETDYEIGKIIHKTELELKSSINRFKLVDTRKNISFARQKGYAYSNGNTARDAAGIAINLPNGDSIPELAIAVAGERDRIKNKTDEIVDFLRETISQMTPSITKDILKHRNFD